MSHYPRLPAAVEFFQPPRKVARGFTRQDFYRVAYPKLRLAANWPFACARPDFKQPSNEQWNHGQLQPLNHHAHARPDRVIRSQIGPPSVSKELLSSDVPRVTTVTAVGRRCGDSS